ncbi:MAG: c-type cytochrome [Rudaea sp.]
MLRVLRWLRNVVAGAVLLAIATYLVIYVLSERVLRRTYPLPHVTLSIPTDTGSIQLGERLAHVHGCVGSCHGKSGQGAVMFDDPKVARIVAPNLTQAVRRYSDGQIVAIVRYGRRPDGSSVFVMPSQAFNVLTDADLGAIIAFLKTLPLSAGPTLATTLGPLGRIGLALGKLKTADVLVAQIVAPPTADNPQAQFGRYLARSICSECHGTNLRGDSNPAFTSPNLAIVRAYSLDVFKDLLVRGTALGDRQLPTMTSTARERLAYLTEDEISALYAYLHTVTP